MSFLVQFAITAAITAVSTIISARLASARADDLEKLAAEKLRLQQQSVKFEAMESQRKIDVQRRLYKSTRRYLATSQGQTVELGLGSSSNLADVATESSARGASELLSKRLQSSLSLQQADFDIATFDSTPGLAEQLVTGGLGAAAGVSGTTASAKLKKNLATSGKGWWT
jgi:hypothetical protein